jgi:hypothetical protein
MAATQYSLCRGISAPQIESYYRRRRKTYRAGGLWFVAKLAGQNESIWRRKEKDNAEDN